MIYDELAMNNGVIFQRTYDILNEKMRQGIINLKNGSNGVDGMATLDAALFVSVVVNCSFACELFLKSMLPQNTRGHKLDDLFSALAVKVLCKVDKVFHASGIFAQCYRRRKFAPVRVTPHF